MRAIEHVGMIIHWNETRIRTIAQMRAVLEGTQELEFTVGLDAPSRFACVALALVRFDYGRLKRCDKGDVLAYLRQFGCFGRA